LGAGDLACAQCGWLVHSHELTSLGQDALAIESRDPRVAVELWRRCLALLPQDSTQAAQLRDRVAVLSGQRIDADWQGQETLQPGPVDVEAPPRDDPWPLAFAKTTGSMALCVVVYYLMFHSMIFAVGFVLLILVHEMGHVIAMRRWGLHASPPIFIPFLGALINLREPPPNAKVEAIVGIGGPLLGTVGAIACYLIALQFKVPDADGKLAFTNTGALLLQLSTFGFMLNLFNMLPVPPLDGGRITAAVSPWIWMPGVFLLLGIIARDYVNYGHVNPIMVMVLIFALPRLWGTLKGRDRDTPYYQISRRASFTIATLYVTLGVTLLFMYFITRFQVNALVWSLR